MKYINYKGPDGVETFDEMIYKQIAEVVAEMKKYGRPQKEITKYIEVATSDPRANILDKLSNDTLNTLLW